MPAIEKGCAPLTMEGARAAGWRVLRIPTLLCSPGLAPMLDMGMGDDWAVIPPDHSPERARVIRGRRAALAHVAARLA
jgi:hypothetical protein